MSTTHELLISSMSNTQKVPNTAFDGPGASLAALYPGLGDNLEYITYILKWQLSETIIRIT